MKSATKGIVTHEMFPFLSSCNQMSPENTRQSPDEVGSAQINSIVRFWTCLDMSGAELEQGNYSLRRSPKLIMQQRFIEQR